MERKSIKNVFVDSFWKLFKSTSIFDTQSSLLHIFGSFDTPLKLKYITKYWVHPQPKFCKNDTTCLYKEDVSKLLVVLHKCLGQLQCSKCAEGQCNSDRRRKTLPWYLTDLQQDTTGTSDLCSNDGIYSANQVKSEGYVTKSNPYRLIATLFQPMLPFMY